MRKFIILISCAILTSCISVGVTPLGGAQFYQTYKEPSVFYSRDQIHGEYEEIAILKASSSDMDVLNENNLLSKLLLKAKEIGADGVIYEQSTERTKGGGFYAYGAYLQDEKGTLMVIAFRYKEG